MRAKTNGAAAAGILRAFACVALALCVLACLCAPALADEAAGDGSKSGSVVDVGSANEGDSGSANAGSSGASFSGGEGGSSASGGASKDDAASDAGGDANAAQPEPLDSPNNTINDGQVSDSSFLYDASIAELAGADSYYDGQTVQVTGEVVGDAIRVLDGSEAEYYWITLLDPDSGSSVVTFMRESDVSKIDTYGAYGKNGTILRVRGIYHLVCPEHEGESDLHVEVVSVVSSGWVHPDEFDPKDFLPGIGMAVVGAVCALAFWRMRERSR